MSVTINECYAKLTVTETLSTNVPAASAPDIIHSAFNIARTNQTSSSTPPVTKIAAFEQALAAGAATIDLTSLTGTNGAAVTGEGLRVQYMLLVPKSTNTGVITISKGAANGYDGFGADFSIELPAGAGGALLINDDNGSDIAAGNKTLDLAGTLVESLQVVIVMG